MLGSKSWLICLMCEFLNFIVFHNLGDGVIKKSLYEEAPSA
jgi:hypothetical protein